MRINLLMLTCVIAAASAEPARAQSHGGTHPQTHRTEAASPYAGFGSREIKSLSAEQVSDLKAGRGAGLALAAELNGYPGPLHLLELADELDLSEKPRARMRVLIDAMKTETIALGERLVAEELALDRLFSEKRANEPLIQAATSRIGALQGQLRAAHLRYHLNTLDSLSAHQIARYGELRGYLSSHTR